MYARVGKITDTQNQNCKLSMFPEVVRWMMIVAEPEHGHIAHGDSCENQLRPISFNTFIRLVLTFEYNTKQ